MGVMMDLIGDRDSHSATFPHFCIALRFILPMGVPYTSLQRISMPFFYAVWIGLLVTFVVVFIVHRMIFGQSFFDEIQIAVGGTINRIPAGIRARLLVASWMLTSLILRNAYQGALFDILQAQIRYQPIETVEDVIRFNYTIYCTVTVCKRLEEGLPHLQKQLSVHANDIDSNHLGIYLTQLSPN